eukprot:TRINITY_DN1208_c0_g1_i1.p1 TRINITY_DN1208_c0_g1~~TRINITY_DN1208_c0_g1_i1.p1  ORF type:complete len:453 (-),score=83.34 TRINITY_DN1208_c0_g1_i1:39-1226(-)
MDVTRSRGDDSKILYDKLPMMYGQMMIKNYIPDPALSFAAIGDAACGDIGPLQVCDFAAGNDLDDWIKKLWLEEGGGGTGEESYELAALYYAKHSELKGGKKGFFFVTGDEAFYTFVNKDEVKRVIGDTYPENISSNYIWKELERKYNVFFLYPRKDMTQRHADIDAEIAARLKREGAKTGDVAISLAWDSRTDLDLHVITPNGEEIYYSHKKSKCNGELDVDMNVRGESETPVENVYWPTGKAPAGKYTVMVHLYAYHGTNGTPAIPFRVQVKVGEEVKMYKSTIKTAKTKLKVCDFEFNPVKKDPHAYDAYSEEVILEKWRGALLPGRILILEDPKAIVDTILGVLSVFSGSRTIEQYVADLQERGQSETRISQVKKILGGACLKEIPIEDDV